MENGVGTAETLPLKSGSLKIAKVILAVIVALPPFTELKSRLSCSQKATVNSERDEFSRNRHTLFLIPF